MVIFTVTTSGGWFTYYLAILEHLYKKEGKMKDIVMKSLLCSPRSAGRTVDDLSGKDQTTRALSGLSLISHLRSRPFVNVAVILILSNQYFKLLKDYKARNFGQGTVDKNACLFYEEKTK